MFNIHDINRDEMMLRGGFRSQGYDWWWHSFTGVNEKTGKERAFFIEFFLCNPALAEDGPVLGQLPENRLSAKRPSYLMVKAGSWGDGKAQLHRFFPRKDTEIHENAPYSIKAGDCYASENCLKGSVSISREEAEAHPEYMCDSGEMSWELEVSKIIAFNVGYGASRLLRRIEAFEMYWHAEGMKTAFNGTVVYNGEKYKVTPENCFGYSDKNWGRNFTSPWVWLSSNCMESIKTGRVLENSVFDIGGGCPRVYCVPLKRKLLGAFYYEGEEYEYNFSKFWMLPRTRFESKESETRVYWHIRQENLDSVMDTKIICDKKDMLMVNYEAPDGSKRHNRLWNGGNGRGRIRLYKKNKGSLELIDDIKVSHVGCEYGEYCEG